MAARSTLEFLTLFKVSDDENEFYSLFEEKVDTPHPNYGFLPPS